MAGGVYRGDIQGLSKWPAPVRVAAAAYEAAIGLTDNAAERAFLERDLSTLGTA